MKRVKSPDLSQKRYILQMHDALCNRNGPSWTYKSSARYMMIPPQKLMQFLKERKDETSNSET